MEGCPHFYADAEPQFIRPDALEVAEKEASELGRTADLVRLAQTVEVLEGQLTLAEKPLSEAWDQYAKSLTRACWSVGYRVWQEGEWLFTDYGNELEAVDIWLDGREGKLYDYDVPGLLAPVLLIRRRLEILRSWLQNRSAYGDTFACEPNGRQSRRFQEYFPIVLKALQETPEAESLDDVYEYAAELIRKKRPELTDPAEAIRKTIANNYEKSLGKPLPEGLDGWRRIHNGKAETAGK